MLGLGLSIPEIAIRGKFAGGGPPAASYYRVPIVSTVDDALNTASGFVTPGGLYALTATLDVGEAYVPRAGFIRNLRCYTYGNASAVNTTLRLLKNGVATGLTLTIGALATGYFEDTTNFISVAAGDKVTFEIVRGDAGTIRFSSLVFDYLTETGSAWPIGAVGTNFSVTGTRFVDVAGSSGVLFGASAMTTRTLIPAAATAKNAAVYISANTRASDVVFTLRKNAVVTLIAITVPAGATGWFTDLIDTDSVAAGDDLEWQIVGAGTGNFQYTSLSFELDPVTIGETNLLSATVSNPVGNSTRYGNYGSGMLHVGSSNAARDVRYRTVVRGTGIIDRLYAVCTANTRLDTCPVVLRDNGVDTSLTVTVPAATTGTFTDLVDTHTFADGDQMDIALVNPSAAVNTVTFGSVSMRLRATPESGTPVPDADATAFITAAGISDSNQEAAIRTLVGSLKYNSLWAKLDAIYPMVGGTATAHKFNLKDPRDLDAAYRLDFTGGWTHSATGALPNGTNALADTHVMADYMGTTNDMGIAYYSRTVSAGNYVEMGARDAVGTVDLDISFAGQFYAHIGNLGQQMTYANTASDGFYNLSRVSSTDFRAFRNGTQTGINGSFNSNTLVNRPIYLAALNDSVAPIYSNRECAFASIGKGFTVAEAATYYTIIQVFQTTLSRQV